MREAVGFIVSWLPFIILLGALFLFLRVAAKRTTSSDGRTSGNLMAQMVDEMRRANDNVETVVKLQNERIATIEARLDALSRTKQP